MTHSKTLLWKFLLALFLACAVGSFLAWGVLLTAICSTAHAHRPDTQHHISYSCHGMTVFITRFEEALRQWLIPTGALFIVLSVIAGVMVALSSGKLRVKVEVHMENSSQDKPRHQNGG